MAAAYTRRLLVASSAGYQISAPAPAGYIWVVRCIDWVNTGSAAASVGCYIHPEGYWFQQGSVPASNGHLQWQGRQVIEAGEAIGVAVPTSSLWVVITGYELAAGPAKTSSLPSPAPAPPRR